MRAESAFVIVARAWEQVKRAAEYDSFYKAGSIQDPPFDAAFDVPRILWFSREESEEEAELLKAHQDADEDEESKSREAADAAAAAGAAADEGAGEDAAGGGGSDDDDDDEDSGNASPGGGLAALFIAATSSPTPEAVYEQYPHFEGVDHSPEHKANIVASKAFYRKQQQRRSNAKAKVVASNRLAAARLDSLRWLPTPFAEVRSAVIGLAFPERWGAEQHARSWAASMDVHGGVKIAMNHESLLASGLSQSSSTMRPGASGRQRRPTAPLPGKARARASRRLQLSRSRAPCSTAHSRTSTCPWLQSAPPPRPVSFAGMRFMGSVKRAARISMTVDRAVDMAALPGYADALGACGHKATQRLSRPCCPLFRSPSGMPHSSLSVISPGSSVQHRRPHNARDPDQGGEAHSRAEEEEWHAAKWRHFQRG